MLTSYEVFKTACSYYWLDFVHLRLLTFPAPCCAALRFLLTQFCALGTALAAAGLAGPWTDGLLMAAGSWTAGQLAAGSFAAAASSKKVMGCGHIPCNSLYCRTFMRAIMGSSLKHLTASSGSWLVPQMHRCMLQYSGGSEDRPE